MLPPWKERSQIVANLANPAFCGKIIHNCIKGYKDEGNPSFPFALSFFVLPLILHKQTRDCLPSSSRKTLHTWLDENNQLKINLAGRIKSYMPFTKETIMFLIASNAVTINEKGEIEANSIKSTFTTEEDNDELLDCFKKAQLLGKILAKSGNISTIYSIIGVSRKSYRLIG